MHTKHILIWLNLGWFRDVTANFKKGHLIKVNCQIRGSRDRLSSFIRVHRTKGSIDIPVFVVFAQMMDRAVRCISADGSTQTGFFPPSSRITGVKYSAAAFITNFPILGPPVKKIISNLKKLWWHVLGDSLLPFFEEVNTTRPIGNNYGKGFSVKIFWNKLHHYLGTCLADFWWFDNALK